MNPLAIAGEAFTFDVSALTSALTLVQVVPYLSLFKFDRQSLFCCKDKR